MAAWALAHPWLTFFLAAMALRVAWVWGQAVRRQERVVRVEPPPPLQSTIRVERVCPRCQTTDELDEDRSAIEASLTRTEAIIKRWDKGN